jgi:DNA-binding NarL/FixJ family response regulator
MNTSVLWISSPQFPCRDGVKRSIRGRGLLLVTLDSVDEAFQMLRQFRAGAVVLHVPGTSESWGVCERLVHAGSPVVVAIDETRMGDVQRYWTLGCAGVMATSCPADTLAAMLQNVASGGRQVMWLPETAA